MVTCRLLLAAVIAALIIATLYYSASLTAEGSKGVNLGIEFNTHATAVWIALDKHLFEKYGVPLGNIYKFRTGVELAAGIRRGVIDAAWACLAPIFKLIDKGYRVYIVAAAHEHGYGCVARPGLRSIEELKRLGVVKAAVTGPGAQTHVLLLLAARRFGFNVSIRFVKPPAIIELVERGLVDVACLPEHYLSVAASRGLRILFTSRDVWSDMPGSYLVVTERLLKRHPGIVCKLYMVDRDGVEYAIQHPREAAAIDARYLGITPELAAESISRLRLTWRLDIEAMQRLADVMYEAGLLKHRLNVSRYVVDIAKLCGWEG